MPDITKKRIHFIINPASGNGFAGKEGFENLILNNLNKGLFEYIISYTTSAQHAYELSRKSAENNYDVIAAVGGDGTVNRVAKGLFGSKSVLALVPVGSGNGLARYLNMPLDPEKSIGLINSMAVKEIDTVTINEELFVSIAGVGFDALVAKKFAKAEYRGFFSYFHIALQSYPGYRPRKYKMVIDGKPLKRKALFISFANSNQFGYNTVISPEASINDGMVDVCIVQKVPMLSAPYVLGLLWRNKIDHSGYLEIIKAKEIQLSRNKNRCINLDGEPVKVGKDLSIKVNPCSLKIIA
ncbi:MAG TPA: YegS/Rv2252/BmrU family lipid kinase [Lentimicrobium sp.]|nr:YegS/Rv2252/BmrU family lipid kinase [Lentimicrobium sp.]